MKIEELKRALLRDLENTQLRNRLEVSKARINVGIRRTAVSPVCA